MTDVVRVPKLLTEPEAAKALGVSVDTLRRLRKARKIGYTRVGGRVRYTEQHLADYIDRENVEPCRGNETTDPARSATIGCCSGQTARSGAGPGSMPQLDRSDVHRLAQTIFKRPN